jgi:hypothetical protein
VLVTQGQSGRVVIVLALAIVTGACGAERPNEVAVTFADGAIGVVSVAMSDRCAMSLERRVAALGVWVDGRHEHDILLFPASGHPAYDSLVGPLAKGRHRIELRPSDYWTPSVCMTPERVTVAFPEAKSPTERLYRHAPVLEVRADTVGEQSDVPLYAYAESTIRDGATSLRYTTVFSNEDGGTPTRALLARWGRTTDIEEVFEVGLQGDRTVGEVFQGPDHVVRPFRGRRQGVAPILLVATLNNMVTDRGRGVVSVRPVPAFVDLSHSTRESTMDGRAWVYRVMERELEAEGRIAEDAPVDKDWEKRAPGPRAHVYLEAELHLTRALVAAWVRDREGRRHWSHYERLSLAINRDGFVRSAVSADPNPAAIAEAGWACLTPAGEQAGGTCEIDATRVFVMGTDDTPGPNLVTPARFILRAGEEAALRPAGLARLR